MKKFIALILAMLLMLALVACGGNETPNDTSNNGTSVTDSDNTSSSDESTENNKDKETPLPPDIDPANSVSGLKDVGSGMVVCDNENVKITCTGYEVGTENEDKYYFEVENKTADTIALSCNTYVVNGKIIGRLDYANENSIAPNTTKEVFLITPFQKKIETIVGSVDDVSCIEMILNAFPCNEYGVPLEEKGALAENIMCSLTKDGHTHKADWPEFEGELFFENEELAIYLGEPVEKGSHDTVPYMIVNKTAETITIDNHYISKLTVMDVYELEVDPYNKTSSVYFARELAPNYAFEIGQMEFYDVPYTYVVSFEFELQAHYGGYCSEATEDNVLKCNGTVLTWESKYERESLG